MTASPEVNGPASRRQLPGLASMRTCMCGTWPCGRSRGPTGLSACQRSFVLDHAGKPPIASGRPGGGDTRPWTGAMAAWAADLRALATLPNVAFKLSWLVTEADWDSRTPGQLRTRSWSTCWSGWAQDRTMFGSDWPVCLLAAS